MLPGPSYGGKAPRIASLFSLRVSVSASWSAKHHYTIALLQLHVLCGYHVHHML
jgi:hypothetical protein